MELEPQSSILSDLEGFYADSGPSQQSDPSEDEIPDFDNNSRDSIEKPTENEVKSSYYGKNINFIQGRRNWGCNSIPNIS